MFPSSVNVDTHTICVMLPTGGKFTWSAGSAKSACDEGAGELYLSASSEQVSNEEACKRSCESAAACRSITYYSSGWCSHFSTECKQTKQEDTGVSMGLSRAATTGAPAGPFILRDFDCSRRPHVTFPTFGSRKCTPCGLGVFVSVE